MDEKTKAMLEQAAKAIGEGRELFAAQRSAADTARASGTPAAFLPEPDAEKLLSLVDSSGLGWLADNDEERARFLEELEARIAAARQA